MLGGRKHTISPDLRFEQVFCGNLSFPCVVVVPLPFLLWGCHAVPPCRLLMWSSQSSYVSWADVQGWLHSWRERVFSWWSPDNPCFMRTRQLVITHSNCLADSWCMLVDTVWVSHWFFPFVRPFVGRKPCLIFVRLRVSRWCACILLM